jgi:hypothetical protein
MAVAPDWSVLSQGPVVLLGVGVIARPGRRAADPVPAQASPAAPAGSSRELERHLATMAVSSWTQMAATLLELSRPPWNSATAVALATEVSSPSHNPQ